MTSPVAGTVVPSEAPASEHLFARAARVTPGGVNSPVRAFRAVGGVPRFMVSGQGAYLTDADGRYARLAGAAGVTPGEAVSPQVVYLGADDAGGWPMADFVPSNATPLAAICPVGRRPFR